MNKDRAIEQIEKEFSTAAQARELGNDGMVRVCARRCRPPYDKDYPANHGPILDGSGSRQQDHHRLSLGNHKRRGARNRRKTK